MDGYTFSMIVIAVLIGNLLWWNVKRAAKLGLRWWDAQNRKADRLISPWDPDGDISGIGALRAQPGERDAMPGPRVDVGLPASGSSARRPSGPPNPLDPSVTPLPPYGSQESGR